MLYYSFRGNCETEIFLLSLWHKNIRGVTKRLRGKSRIEYTHFHAIVIHQYLMFDMRMEVNSTCL